jgi:energy-coupling factor transporter ATP-binding protein EcfA2
MPDVIVTHRLTKYYDAHCALDGLNLRIAQGTVYGLLGRNGAGKTTAIKMLLGMAHPSSGRAEVLGEDAATLRPETRARIAYLAEGPSLVSLDDRRPGGPLHRPLLRALEPAALGADPRPFRAFAPPPHRPALPRPAGPGGPGAQPWRRTRSC